MKELYAILAAMGWLWTLAIGSLLTVLWLSRRGKDPTTDENND
jgi:hypothetical protein